MDALQTDRADQIGDPVILAASYVDGDRFIARCYYLCANLNYNLKFCQLIPTEYDGNCTGVRKSIDVCHIHSQLRLRRGFSTTGT